MLNKGGFTLIELIVVLAITGVMFGLLGSSFYSVQESNQLRSATQEVRSLIDLTRQNSLTGLIKSGCAPSSFKGYGLRFTSGLFGGTGMVSQLSYCGAASATVVNTFAFREFNHIEIVSPAPVQTYFLKNTAELLNSSGSKVEIELKLRNVRSNECSQININQFGTIQTTNEVSCT